jgi:excisionase family DNA binding protein
MADRSMAMTSGRHRTQSADSSASPTHPSESDAPLSDPTRSDTPVLSVAATAALLGISTSHAYELIKRGVLPALHLGRRVVVPYRCLDSLFDSAAFRPDGSEP